MVHPCIRSQEGSLYPHLLSLVLGGYFERLASTLGDLDKGAEGTHIKQSRNHIKRTGISFCLLGDSDEALPLPYKVICSMALENRCLTKLWETNSTAVSYGLDVHFLAWSSHPVIVQPEGRLPENIKFGKFAMRPMLFTDRSQFNLSGSDGRVTVWRSTGERYQAANTIQHNRFGGGSVFVWGGIPHEGRRDQGPVSI